MVRDDPAPHSMRVPFFVSAMISQPVGCGAGRSFPLARAAVKGMKPHFLPQSMDIPPTTFQYADFRYHYRCAMKRLHNIHLGEVLSAYVEGRPRKMCRSTVAAMLVYSMRSLPLLLVGALAGIGSRARPLHQLRELV